MLQFVIIIIALLIVTLYFLLLPILRSRNTVSYARNEQNIHFAQERLQELEAQLKNATISATDYEALKQEIEQSLADDLEQNPKQKESIKTDKSAAVFIATFVPIAACCIYLLIGNPQAISYQNEIDKLKDPHNIGLMLEQIEDRLQQKPDDEKGWSVLGNTYMALGEYDKAQHAYRRLLELTGNNPDVLIQLADAIAMSNSGNALGEPEKLIRKALSLNPNHIEGLWLAGMIALQKNQPEQAKTYWQKLLPAFANMPAQQQELQALIQQAQGMQNTSNTETGQTGINNKIIEVSVSIDEELKQQVQTTDIVFVFAKAKQDSNTAPRAPLAVKRLTVADLPANISLSDADAMMPQLTISKFNDIIVNARISKSGNPIAQKGDLESASTAVNNKTPIKLLINSIVD